MLVQSELVALLNEVLAQTAKLRKGGVQATYFCPECKHYKRKLEVNLDTGQWHCWTCNIGGTYLGSLLKKVRAPQNYRERLFKLTGDIRLSRRLAATEKSTEVVLPDDFWPFAKFKNDPEYRNAMKYLVRRGLIREDILRYNIGYCAKGPYANHVIVPSYDGNGKLNFFVGRRYYNIEGQISYKKPEASMNVVGFESFINYNEPLNLCEGVFDAFAIRNNAVPLFSKYISKKLQAAIVINKVKRVNMILDNDAYGDAVENCKLLQRLGTNVHLVKLSGKDPSVLGFEKVTELIDRSKPFNFDQLLAYEMGLNV